MSKFTPGPWSVCVEVCHTGLFRHEVYRAKEIENAKEPTTLVESIAIVERVEDARLIAAAPELYEAAKAVIERWDTPLWKDAEPTGQVINRLRASLAKVEGE